MAKNKHLTDLERLQIEQWLKQRISVKKIAANLGKSTSTISREIRNRAVSSNKSAPHRIPNRCKHRFDCTIRGLCFDKPSCDTLCRSCKLCNSQCADFDEDICQKLSAPPYVCNGCIDESRCVLMKKYYLHSQAQKAYNTTLIETRVGANISEGELLRLDEFVTPLIRQGQSVHHIFANNPDEFLISEKSVYRYVASGLLKARNIDMPRVCRLKPRNGKPLEHKVDPSCRINRTYDDYQAYMKQHHDVAVVEMDSVIGRIGGRYWNWIYNGILYRN